MPAAWAEIPSLQGLTGRKVEVQVRTLAQHIWAAASHKLQYKHEESVPLPLRRSIYRVSALLETVDLEFSRVLEERDEYIRTQLERAAAHDKLDVNIVESILDDVLPAKSKDDGAEDYSELLVDLQHFNIDTRGALQTLLSEHLDAILQADAREVSDKLGGGEEDYDDEPGERLSDRLARGVFYTHVGLTRQALGEKFGEEVVREWLFSRAN